MLRHLMPGLLLFGLVGCTVQEAPDAPGINGRLVLRLWDREARANGLPPAVVTAQVVRQDGLDFDRLTMEPVTLKRPLKEGEIWLLSSRGRYQLEGSELQPQPQPHGDDRATIALEPPIRLSGWMRGVPVAGTAAGCSIDPGGRRIVLDDVVLVRDGMRLTGKRMLIDAGSVQGMTGLVPGGTVVSTGLAALP